MVCRGGGRHTALFLSSLSHGKIFEETPGVGAGMGTEVATEVDVVLSAMALLTIRPVDRRAVANFILTDSKRRITGWRI